MRFAHLPTVKNLNRFVSSQVMQALSDRVYPRAIEAALLQLRELFLEDQQRLPAEDQQRRLQEAAVILEVLRKAARDPARAWQEPEPVVVREPVMNDTPSKPWWAQPIRFAKGSARSARRCSNGSGSRRLRMPCGPCLGAMKIARS